MNTTDIVTAPVERKPVEKTVTPLLPQDVRDRSYALLCILEAGQLTGKIGQALLVPPGAGSPPWGGLASGFRRIAARLEVIGTDKTPDFSEFGIDPETGKPIGR